MERSYCDVCQRETDVEVIQMEETYPVKGESITIDAKVKVCGLCRTDLFDEYLDSNNLSAAFEIYRQKHGLLGPDDVRRIRKRYQLSQRGLASLLEWSPATVARYEAGALPSMSHNEQLKRLRDDIDYVSGLYDRMRSHYQS
jgi:putative zinc finger/helix-turn-helix YgiT family protein